MSSELIIALQFIGGLTSLGIMAVIPGFKAKVLGIAVASVVGLSVLGSGMSFDMKPSGFMKGVTGQSAIESVN